MIHNKENYLLRAGVHAAIKAGCFCYREQNIWDNFSHAVIEQQTGFQTADIFGKDGNGFQIVVQADANATQKIGSITC